jgi:hypothetical protein
MSRRSETERREREALGELRDVQAGRAAAAPVPVAAPSGEAARENRGWWWEPTLNTPEMRAPARDFDLCIYHKDCADGFTAAWAVAQRLPGIECVPARYGSEPPALRGRRIVLVDFSYEPETLDRLAAENDALLVIDHHASAVRRLRGRVPPAGASSTAMRRPELLLDENHSGAMLAWRFFHGAAEPPTLIRYVEDRDLWRHALLRSREINAVIGATDFGFPAWTRLVERLDTAGGFRNAIFAGEALLSARRKEVREVVGATQRWMRIGGADAPVINAPKHLISDALHELAGGAPFAAGYFDRADGRREFSLRSREDGADVAAIAERYGGGGHVRAAGFVADAGWEGDPAPPAAKAG